MFKIPSTVNEYADFFTTTNKDDPIDTKHDDRRNVIIRASDEKIGDKEYFNMMRKLLNNKCVLRTCFYYFKSIKRDE